MDERTYTTRDMQALADDMATALREWGKGRIRDLAGGRPGLAAVSPYMERGLDNWVARERGRLGDMVDKAAMFIADGDGNINADTVMEDLLGMFRNMPKRQATVGVFEVEYGKGEVCVTIPHDPLLDIILGDLGQVRLTADDLEGLREEMRKAGKGRAAID